MIESQIVARVLPSKCREAVKVLLQEVYGYEDFRNLEVYDDLFRGKEKLQLSQGQLIEEVIMEAEKGIKGDSSAHNLLLTAPTGAGKSLLFQLPAIYLGNEYKLLTLVVSPLKALIVDQVEALQELGYERVAYASSDLSPEQKNEVYRRVREGEVDLFYLSPELLLAYDISYFVGERRIGLVVVDEAHTVTTWGKEFRVEDFLDGHKTIIYYPFAGGIDMKLKTWVYPANWHWVASYYGKKDKEQKAEIIQAFKEGEKKIIVATKAFGMGVDISDIDRVYHVAPSSTFVDYIQEIGRAARDKNITGVAVTDFNERDFYYMKRLHSAGAISQEQLGMILKKVWEIYLMKGCSDKTLGRRNIHIIRRKNTTQIVLLELSFITIQTHRQQIFQTLQETCQLGADIRRTLF
jgi:superfamily II DNA helicase RecQ